MYSYRICVIALILWIDFFCGSESHKRTHRHHRRSHDHVPANLSNSEAEVIALPGLHFPINFRHYSGFLKASPTHFLHYWFVESQHSPSSDPVLVWLNGGPGCSSLDGLLSELGPFHVRNDGNVIYDNTLSWNKIANVLFLEAPAGVGFSYSTDGNVSTNDDQTSLENYNALKEFFAAYPQFQKNDLYITGESYGGVYVPTLAARIAEDRKTKLNLKGIAVGNGMLSYSLNTDALVEFAYGHGLFGDRVWAELVQCCGGCTDTCSFAALNGTCGSLVGEVLKIIEGIGLNVYDLYRDCYHPVSSASFYPRYWFDMKMAFPQLHRRFTALQAIAESRHDNMDEEMDEPNNGQIPCINTTAVTNYLNKPSVRTALHIPDSVGHWDVCSAEVGSGYKNQYKNMTGQITTLLSRKMRVLIYNGDTDMACNFLMNQKFVDSLKLPIVEERRAWWANNQIAGFVSRYRYLDFLTVKGAGHMVPQWKPIPALKMIASFLQKVPY